MSIIYPSSNTVTLSSNAVTASISGTPTVTLSSNAVTASISNEPTVKTKNTTVTSYSRTTIGSGDVNYARPIHGTFGIADYDTDRKKVTIYNRSSDDLFLSIVDDSLDNLDAFSIPGPFYDFENLPFTASTGITAMASASEGIYFGDAYYGGPGSNAIEYNGTNYGKLILWNGSTAVAVGGGVTGSYSPVSSVETIVSSSQGIFIGGRNLTNASGTAIDNAALWNGSSWTNLSGTSGIINAWIHSFYSASEGLYAGFHYSGGATFKGIALWDGTNWNALSGGLNGTVYGLESGSDGLYVAGLFTKTYNDDVTLRYTARWDGSTWNSLGNGLKGSNSNMNISGAIAVLSASEGVYFGGGFAGDYDNTTSASAFLKWDGSSWSDLGTCFGGGTSGYAQIWRIKSGSYGIIVSGDFDYQKDSDSSGTRLGAIGKWDGASWQSLTSQGNPAFKNDPINGNTRIQDFVTSSSGLFVGTFKGYLTNDGVETNGANKLITFSTGQLWDGNNEYARTITTTVPVSGTYVSDGLQAQLKHVGLLLSGTTPNIFIHEIS